MIGEIEAFVLQTLQTLFDQWGWLGVAGLMVFENATGITPSEVILGLAGWFLLSNHDLPFVMVFLGGLFAAIGSLAGASIAYWAARLGGRPLVDRVARLLRVPPAHLDKAEAAFHRRGVSMVLFGRMVPGLRTLISIPAGLARMSFPVFASATFIGAYLWCTLLIGLGYFLGHEWEHFSGMFRRYAIAAAGGGSAVLALVYITRKLFDRFSVTKEGVSE